MGSTPTTITTNTTIVAYLTSSYFPTYLPNPFPFFLSLFTLLLLFIFSSPTIHYHLRSAFCSCLFTIWNRCSYNYEKVHLPAS